MSAEDRKQYWRDYYLKHRVLKPRRALVSKYRWKSDGHNSGTPAHIVIAETALGKPLPHGAEVHHVDGNGHNNDHSNLVVCPSNAYHKLLHIRTAALDICGHADWLRCIRCKQYDDPVNMHLYVPKDQVSPRAHHRSCQTEYEKNRRYRKGGVA